SSAEQTVQLVCQPDARLCQPSLDDRPGEGYVVLAQTRSAGKGLVSSVGIVVGMFRLLKALRRPVLDPASRPVLDVLRGQQPGNVVGPGTLIAIDVIDQVGVPEAVQVRPVFEKLDLSQVSTSVVVVPNMKRLMNILDQVHQEKKGPLAFAAWGVSIGEE